jgi:superfamily II DNA helicase RecQ
VPQNEELSILRRIVGYDSLRGSQADVISHVTDALVLMPTGAGKSL